MSRFEDSPELFGDGGGIASHSNIECQLCGTEHNGRENADGEPNETGEAVSIGYTEFAGIQVCECCFENIEDEILHRMPEILKWYRCILDHQKKKTEHNESLLKAVEE